jgi:hypothetical protein
MASATATTSGRPEAARAFSTGDRTTRLIALAGLTSFILIVAGAFIAPPLWSAPGTHSSAARAAAYAHEHQAREIASLFAYTLAMGCFLCFAAGLWSRLRQIEPAPHPLAAAFALGAVGLVVLVLAGFATGGVLTYRLQGTEVAGVLADTTFALLALSGMPTAVCLGAYALLVFRHGSLPRWTAWLALLGADAHVLITASFMSHDSFLSLEGSVRIWVPATFFAWILAASLALWRARGESSQATSPARASLSQR